MGITVFGPASWLSCSQQTGVARAAWGQRTGDRLAEPPGHVGGESDTTGVRLAPRKTECSRGQGADAQESWLRASLAWRGGGREGAGRGQGTGWSGTEVRSRFCRKVSQLLEKSELC